MLQTKKGFTLIETLLVLSIVTILFLLIRTTLTIQQPIVQQAQQCIHFLTTNIQNITIAGLTQRGIQSGSTQIFPIYYTVDISPELIEFFYADGQWNSFIEPIYLNNPVYNNCYIPWYTLSTSGTMTQFGIHNKTMTIQTPTNTFTGQIAIIVCQDDTCQTAGYIDIDTRSQNITQRLCGVQSWDLCQ